MGRVATVGFLNENHEMKRVRRIDDYVMKEKEDGSWEMLSKVGIEYHEDRTPEEKKCV